MAAIAVVLFAILNGRMTAEFITQGGQEPFGETLVSFGIHA